MFISISSVTVCFSHERVVEITLFLITIKNVYICNVNIKVFFPHLLCVDMIVNGSDRFYTIV